MNYQQTIDYLFSQLPIYQRVGKAAYKADLNNTLALDKHLGYPHKKFKTIHVAGTNGKGSISHMLASVLYEAGYKVGLYTSPHLKDFRERIKVNGELICENKIVEFVRNNKKVFETIKPSFFEMTVALAFEYFAEQKVDIAVIEVGLGGRLDSTNVITPELSVITNIGLDHTDLLGNTIEKIAWEKAGIIKRDVPVIISQSQPEVTEIFEQRAKELNAQIIFADSIYTINSENNANSQLQKFVAIKSDNNAHHVFEIDLLGNYQSKNLCGCLAAIDTLNRMGFNISHNQTQLGLKKITGNTGLLGRWQILQNSPLIICDTGHNTDGILQVVDQINKTPHENLHMVIGLVGDKNIDGILSLLPKNASYYFTKASIPRSMNETVLALNSQRFGLNGNCFATVQSAVDEAKKNSRINDLIFIGGSTFVVAEVV